MGLPAEKRETVSQRERLSLGRIEDGDRRQPRVGLKGLCDRLHKPDGWRQYRRLYFGNRGGMAQARLALGEGGGLVRAPRMEGTMHETKHKGSHQKEGRELGAEGVHRQETARCSSSLQGKTR